jgi:hypothetical protein
VLQSECNVARCGSPGQGMLTLVCQLYVCRRSALLVQSLARQPCCAARQNFAQWCSPAWAATATFSSECHTATLMVTSSICTTECCGIARVKEQVQQVGLSLQVTSIQCPTQKQIPLFLQTLLPFFSLIRWQIPHSFSWPAKHRASSHPLILTQPQNLAKAFRLELSSVIITSWSPCVQALSFVPLC